MYILNIINGVRGYMGFGGAAGAGGGGAGFIIALILIGGHLKENPETAELLIDAALVKCQIDDALYDALDRLVDDPVQQRTLDMIRVGESISQADERSLKDYLKSISKNSAFNFICEAVGP